MNFNEYSYTIAESEGQVNVSLRIDGKFFVPVWAVVEVRDGTATRGLCNQTGYNQLCIYVYVYTHHIKLTTNKY